MPRLSAAIIDLSDSEQSELDRIIHGKRTEQQIALRAKIIVKASEGVTHEELARALAVSHEMSRVWRRRWLELRALEIPVEERL